LANITHNMTSGYFLVLVTCVVKSFNHLVHGEKQKTSVNLRDLCGKKIVHHGKHRQTQQ